ncbi:glycosyltransferase family 2 protein [Halomonas mongoliensis]|uniref:glycosyltransferase family 2 protein n=1 Tax=Halomonas mongoliensis TaxID=321265 RepID=UPI00403AC9F5
MNDLAKVSVIVPVFNAGEKLASSIESLLSQTLSDIEIVIVNDASTDNSGSIIDRLAKEHANIVPVHLSENKGVHEARLAGLKKSTAPWIGFLDADDFARPTMFEKLLSAAIDNDVDIVVCGWQRVDSNRKPLRSKLRFSRDRKVENNVFSRFCQLEFGAGMLWNKLFRRENIIAQADIKFPWRQNINEDMLLNIACFNVAKSIFLVDDILYDYVRHDGSVTASNDGVKAYVHTFRAFALAVSLYSGIDAYRFNSIIDLYRTQLSSLSFKVQEVSDLSDYQKELLEAVEMILSSYPLALALISSPKTPARVPLRLAVESILKRMLMVFR